MPREDAQGGRHERQTTPARLPEQGEGGMSRKPRLTTSAMIASLAAEGQRTKPAPFGHALVALAENPARDRRADGRSRASTPTCTSSRKAYPDRFYQMGMAEQLLMGAAAGHGARRLHAVRDDLCGVRLAPRLRLHLPGDRRGEPERQDRLRAAGPDDGLRPEPPGDRGHRDLPRHAEPDDRRSLRCARDRAGGAGDRGP